MHERVGFPATIFLHKFPVHYYILVSKYWLTWYYMCCVLWYAPSEESFGALLL